jgi:hypothetical protein
MVGGIEDRIEGSGHEVRLIGLPLNSITARLPIPGRCQRRHQRRAADVAMTASGIDDNQDIAGDVARRMTTRLAGETAITAGLECTLWNDLRAKKLQNKIF